MEQRVEREKTYLGDRTIDGIAVTVDGRPLPDGADTIALSADGFEWGYEGPAAAQLAFALLLDHLGDARRAEALHAPFMRAIVANFANEWRMTSADVGAAVAALSAQAAQADARA